MGSGNSACVSGLGRRTVSVEASRSLPLRIRGHIGPGRRRINDTGGSTHGGHRHRCGWLSAGVSESAEGDGRYGSGKQNYAHACSLCWEECMEAAGFRRQERCGAYVVLCFCCGLRSQAAGNARLNPLKPNAAAARTSRASRRIQYPARSFREPWKGACQGSGMLGPRRAGVLADVVASKALPVADIDSRSPRPWRKGCQASACCSNNARITIDSVISFGKHVTEGKGDHATIF
jgi:hypothetical protein